MNPRVINPDPLAVLRDVNNITDQGRVKVRDNFTIVDGGGKNWPAASDFDKSVKNNFDYTQDNAKDAFAQAAREGKPLVVVFGSAGTQDTRQLIEGTIPGAKNRKDAVYMFVDRSKLDPNSELGRHAASNIGNTNWAYTGIFALKPGANGQPSLDNMVANTWGARSEIPSVIADQLPYAQRRMDAQKGRFNIPQDAPVPQKDGQVGPPQQPPIDGRPPQPGEQPKPGEQQKPGETPKPGDTNKPFSDNTAKPPEQTEQAKLEKAAEDRLNTTMSEVYSSFSELPNLPKESYKEREALYQKAIAAADKIDPADLKLAQEKTSRELQAESNKLKEGDPKNPEVQNRIKALKERQAELGLMGSAKGWTRMNYGLNLMHYSRLDDGANQIREGAKHNPELLTNPLFTEQLKKTPYRAAKLQEKFPEIQFGKDPLDGTPEAKKHKPEVTNDPTAKTEPEANSEPEAGIDPQVKINPIIDRPTKQAPDARVELPRQNVNDLLQQLGADPDQMVGGLPENTRPGGLTIHQGEKPGQTPETIENPNTVKPADQLDQKPEAKTDAPAKLKYDGTEADKAIETALNEGRKLVFKIGTKGCSGCDLMTKNNWPDQQVQDLLGEKAVFVDVDGLKSHDLAVKQLNATTWPVTVVATPYKGPDGKLAFREEGRLEWPERGEMTTEMLHSFLQKNLGGKLDPKKVRY